MMIHESNANMALNRFFDQIIDQAQAIGIDTSRLPTNPQAGRFYQLPITGKSKGNKSGRFKLITDGVAFLQNFVTGQKATIKADDLPTDPKAIEERKRAIRLAQEQANRELEKQYQQAAIAAFHIWHDQCHEVDLNHPYLRKKHLKPAGIKQRGSSLVIPIYSLKTGKVESLQIIEPNGSKRFLTGGRIKGNCFVSRKFNPATDKRIILAEGYATSQSLIQHHKVQGWHVVAFNASNLPAVAKQLRQLYPVTDIVISADNDYQTAVKTAAAKGLEYDPNNSDHTRFNAGIYYATEAAKAVQGKIATPTFTAEERACYPDASTDWLDRHLINLANQRGRNHV